MNQEYFIQSSGMGVNSTALTVLLIESKMPLDEVIFADTGAELPGTLYHSENVMRPYLESRGIPLKVVRSRTALVDTLKARKVIPDKIRRWQTRDKKVTPIRAYYRETLFKLKGINQIFEYIGFDVDERRRAKNKAHAKKASEKFDVVKRYPLMELGLNRTDCIQIIRKAGLSIPPKSACFCCPFHKEEEWLEIYKEYPEMFWQAVELEETSKHFPRQLLCACKIPLREHVTKWQN